MTAHRALATVVVGAVIASTFPATASAAPVVPARAVLTAAELPSGSKDYMVFPIAALPAPNGPGPNRSSPCETASYALQRAVAGAQAVEADAWRGDTHFYASVFGRAATAEFTAQDSACGETANATRLPVPADLVRLDPVLLRVNAHRVTGMADVRGATVGVIASSPDDKPLNLDTFWQVFRAQIAKVEKQP
ncbi:hypothetical protein [Tsukamurella spumae]|uniref:DUF3558 domain-containing protein n=1 Tax=Tsukamurella spumae TaxID=44753 RepID=A0A846WYX0_9ACTN|nr:hypothetical protein [Tsukamurella spumae]NKY18153.1 hypothetical protein [Tsukamurella spumae]